LVLEKHHHSNMATRHIPIENWLATLDLREYEEVFKKYGGVEVSNTDTLESLTFLGMTL